LIAYGSIFIAIPHLVSPSEDGLSRTAGLRVVLVCYTFVLLILTAYYIDRRPLRTFGLAVDRRWVIDLCVGIAIGSAIPALAVGVGLVGGWITVEDPGYALTINYVREIGLALLITVSIAITEELVFRGYVLTNAISGLNVRWLSHSVTVATAWGVSAVFFAAEHPISTFADGVHFLTAGFLLGFAYLLTGDLGLPIGIHAGFNFVADYVFSSTPEQSITVVALIAEGPGWLVGQTGVVQTALQFPAALAVVLYVWWHSGSVEIVPKMTTKLNN
jgi:membrane protease YdiL (CAAX protease family)